MASGGIRRKGHSKISDSDFNFIIKNIGVLNNAKTAKKIGVSNTYICHLRCSYKKSGVRSVAEFLNLYRIGRPWQAIVDSGVDEFNSAMRRFYTKHQRLESYKRVIAEMKQQRMRKAA